jgi:hypothetical protein
MLPTRRGRMTVRDRVTRRGKAGRRLAREKNKWNFQIHLNPRHN